MAHVAFLLPVRERYGGQRLSAAMAAALGQGRQQAGAPGRHAQLARHLDLPAAPWPVAALTREVDAGDAAGAAWLRADPAWLRPDINGVRLMAHGEAMGLSRDDSDALLPALRPLFGDAGFLLDAPVPSRWYLQLPQGARLPAFADPADALGGDLFEHLDDGSEGRRWRALGSEAQVVLHNHPWNAGRAAQGLPPVNALWFWGAGRLPDAGVAMRSRHEGIRSDDPTLYALASACAEAGPLPPRYAREAAGNMAFDLTAGRDLQALERDWLRPAVQALRRGAVTLLELDSEDGWSLRLGRRDRLLFWRRALPHWGAAR